MKGKQYYYVVYRFRGSGEPPRGMYRKQWHGPYSKQQTEDCAEHDEWREAIENGLAALSSEEWEAVGSVDIDDQYDRLEKSYSRLGKRQREMLRKCGMLPEQQKAWHVQDHDPARNTANQNGENSTKGSEQ